ncbi:MAG TPA: hypothetical protein PJ981_05980, partial [Accumulibacter sp.]|nr:hypothetical protein [Accumulibacter sp.]
RRHADSGAPFGLDSRALAVQATRRHSVRPPLGAAMLIPGRRLVWTAVLWLCKPHVGIRYAHRLAPPC